MDCFISCQESLSLSCKRAVLGRLPDGKAEANLIHEVSEVVDEVQGIGIDGAHEVTEEVAERIDGPAHTDNQSHRAE